MVRRSAALSAAAVGFCALLAAAAVASAEEVPGCGDSVTVERGDTLHRIAERCGTSVEELIVANPELSSPDRLEIGQELALPVGEPSGAADAGTPTEIGEPGGPEAGEPTQPALSSLIDGLGPIGQAEAEASPSLDPSNIPIDRIIDNPWAERPNGRLGPASARVR